MTVNGCRLAVGKALRHLSAWLQRSAPRAFAPGLRGRDIGVGAGEKALGPGPAIPWSRAGRAFRASRRLSADWLAGGLALALLAGCLPLDKEEALRREVGRLVFLAQTRDFRSTSTCTAASFEVISDQLRTTGGAARVHSVRDALPRLQKGEAVAFEIPGASPNAISEELMSLSLPIGLGLVSAVVGPSRGCMSEVFKADVGAILASPDTTLVYDPGRDAALLLYRPLPVAFFLRGNV